LLEQDRAGGLATRLTAARLQLRHSFTWPSAAVGLITGWLPSDRGAAPAHNSNDLSGASW
jgi:hypothetical protein